MESKNILECIPQNDLDCYYNSIWKQFHKNSINNKSSFNNFTIIQDTIDEKMYKFIMEAGLGSDEILNNIVRMKNSYFDKKNYSKTMNNLITLITNINNVTDLANIIRIFNNIGITTLFTVSVIPHFKCPDIYVLALGEIPLTFESKELYDKQSFELVNVLSNLLETIYQYVTKYWGYKSKSMTKFIKNIITFEILFSKSNLSMDKLNDPSMTYHSVNYNEFLKKFDTGHFWKIILKEINAKPNSNVMHIFYENELALIFIKKFLQKMNKKILSMTKDYLVYCLVKKYGFLFTIDLFDNILLKPTTEKQIIVELFYDKFGYYLESIYELKYGDCQKNKSIYQMFLNMKSYCIDIFEKTTFFGQKTKSEAINKLSTLDMIVGKQDYYIDLSELPKLGEDIYDNLMIIDSFYFNKLIGLIGKPINKCYLATNNDVFSFIVNAYYDPLSNIIYIPTSVINDMFFKLQVDPIYNYGSLGAIIGHEFMHCFDNNGAQFDHYGHLYNWWTHNDYKKYHNEVAKVKNHYSNISFNNIGLNSELSISENIADIAGLKLSLRTYIKNYMPNTDPNNLTITEKNHLKKFFERWAQTLRTIENDNAIEYTMKYDVHSPNIIRVNAPFSHLNEYYQIFNVKPEHQNYLPPDQRTKFLDA